MHRITIAPHAWVFEADADTTLMKAARQAGIRLTRSCQNGTCRACLCPMPSGSVRYTVEWPGITEDERAQGLVLPCVACATSDVTIEAEAAFKPAA
jgi:ferredoxin